MPRPADDTRCPTCGGSAHALDATTQPKFGGREYIPKGARKALDRAWDESGQLAGELDSTYARLRAVIENCKHATVEVIRHQLVGLMPETREMDPESAARMRAEGMGNLVDRADELAREGWRRYGYGDDGAAETEQREGDARG
jgi:hypothetical protein